MTRGSHIGEFRCKNCIGWQAEKAVESDKQLNCLWEKTWKIEQEEKVTKLPKLDSLRSFVHANEIREYKYFFSVPDGLQCFYFTVSYSFIAGVCVRYSDVCVLQRKMSDRLSSCLFTAAMDCTQWIKSFGSVNSFVRGLLLRIDSTSQRTVWTPSSSKLCTLKMELRSPLMERINLSHAPHDVIQSEDYPLSIWFLSMQVCHWSVPSSILQ